MRASAGQEGVAKIRPLEGILGRIRRRKLRLLYGVAGERSEMERFVSISNSALSGKGMGPERLATTRPCDEMRFSITHRCNLVGFLGRFTSPL